MRQFSHRQRHAFALHDGSGAAQRADVAGHEAAAHQLGRIAEGLGDDLGANAGGVAHGHGQWEGVACIHSQIGLQRPSSKR